jgi:quinone-modifying oxidoreductase subunit QmoC
VSTRVDPTLLDEIKAYGAVNTEACFNCGTCTASCPLTDDDHTFPRSTIRLLQMGMRDRLLESSDPWMCYYCGDCTVTCPKGAEPAETMMATRRWLTAQYDRSGEGAKLYTSERAVIMTILRYVVLTLVVFIAFHALTGFDRVVTDHVALNTFAPVALVWAFVLLHFGILAIRLLINTRHMVQRVMRTTVERVNIPLTVYISEFKTFVLHFLTQKRWRACSEDGDHSRWLKHLLLISGYITMLILVVGLLGWFQTDNIYPLYHPQRWLGYYATVVLIYGSVEALVGRFRKQEQIHRFSHPSDWLFPLFLLIGATTGILVHIFRYANWAWPTYIIYIVHLMAMFAMLDTEVGIGKWTHLIYRPLAMYLDAVKKRAGELQQAAPELTPAGTD